MERCSEVWWAAVFVGGPRGAQLKWFVCARKCSSLRAHPPGPVIAPVGARADIRRRAVLATVPSLRVAQNSTEGAYDTEGAHAILLAGRTRFCFLCTVPRLYKMGKSLAHIYRPTLSPPKKVSHGHPGWGQRRAPRFLHTVGCAERRNRTAPPLRPRVRAHEVQNLRDAAATRWPSRVLLLVERRFGGSRAQPLVDRVYDALALRRRRRHVELRRPRIARGAPGPLSPPSGPNSVGRCNLSAGSCSPISARSSGLSWIEL